jgi:LPS sulfotransferase NodH
MVWSDVLRSNRSFRLLPRRRPAPVSVAPSPQYPYVPWAEVQQRLIASGKRFYCICFSIRSGSSLLCDDMTQWGLGAPQEHFQFPDFPVLEGPLWDHLGRLAELWDGDFFALKISWFQAAELTSRLHSDGYESLGFDLGNIFPGLRYIHIVRRDKLRQAISAWRARSSGAWHWPTAAEVDRGNPPYDFASIKGLLMGMITEDWEWGYHFQYYGITPLTVYYEDYIEDRPGYLYRIADFLGVAAAPTPLVDNMQVMRDEWTEQIVERFVTDLHRGL